MKNLVRVINSKNPLPILGDILFDVNEQEKKATLTASDSEVTMGCEVILSECEGGGRFCVGANTLAAMLTEVSEQPLTITATLESDMQFTMSYQDGSAFCPIENADEFPMPKQGDLNETLLGIDSEYLRDALKRSLWATANDDLRPNMCGVNFALVDGCLDIVASNGHVLVKSQKSYAEEVETSRCGSFIMPKKVAKILIAIAESDDSIDIEWNDREAHIGMLGCDITFRLIEGKYPYYNSVIPETFAHQVRCRRTALLSAVNGVAPFAPDSSQLLTMTFEGKMIKVNGVDSDFAQGAAKSISMDADYDDPLSIGVKASSMINMLSKLSTPEIDLNFNDPSRAIVINPVDDESEEEITGLIMPMLLNE